MEWTIVHFIDGDMIEAVRTTWLHDDLCIDLRYMLV